MSSMETTDNLTSLDALDSLDEEKDVKQQPHVQQITITELYNKLQRFGYFAVSTKYIDLRETQQFNKCHIATSVNVTIKNDIIINSLDDLSVIDTIKTCKLKWHLQLLTKETVIVFIGNNNNCKSSIQSFLFNKFGIINFMILQPHNNGLEQFAAKYPWIMMNGEEYKKQDETLYAYPHEIIENKLFLGNYIQSDTVEILSNLKITHIVNVTKETHTKKVKNINYYKMSIDDHEKENILEKNLLLNTINHIDKVLNEHENNRIFVHCHQGVSRSSAVVIAYLMHRNKWNFDKALKFVEEIRPRIYPNEGFKKQLLQFQKQILNE